MTAVLLGTIISVLLVTTTRRRGFAAAIGWAGIFLLQHTNTLLMTEAGPLVRYQHLRQLGILWGEDPRFLLVPLLQLLAVSWSLIARPVFDLAMLRGWRPLLAIIAWAAISATVSEPIARYPQELAFAFFLQALQAATLVLFIHDLPRATLQGIGKRVVMLLGSLGGGDAGSDGRTWDWVTIGLAIFATVTAAVLSVTVYESHPHIPDEVAYLFQAKTFASGMLTLPLPPVPEAFEGYLHFFGASRWWVAVPPGWPAVLTVGVLVGAPWLINPLLTGVNVILGDRLLRRFYDPPTARIGTILLATSPWQLFLGMSYMNHQWVMFLALLATLGVARSRESGHAAWGWFAGGALGVMALARQLDALVLAILLGLWGLGLGARRLRLPALLGLVVGAILAVSPILLYNTQLTGKPQVFPVMLYAEATVGPNANAYGFGPDRGMGTGWAHDPRPGHDPLDGLLNTNLNTTAMQVDLFGWPIGSLAFVLAFAAFGRWTRSDRIMVSVCLAVLIAYFLNYFGGGPDFGARYWHLMALPLIALSARGMSLILTGAPSTTEGAGRAGMTLLLLLTSALFLFLPWRATNKYHHYRGMRGDLRQMASDPTFDHSLMLIQGKEMPDYESAIPYSTIDLLHGPIFAWDRSPEVRSRLLDSFSDRTVVIVSGPSRTGGPYTVVAGPLTVGEARAYGGPR